jgi:drug/metabolite transporter (DMT)-like permease
MAISGSQLVLLALLGLVGTSAHLAVTWALRLAPAATIAPIQYLEIPFATLFGLVIFGELPNGLAAAGIVVTIAAGLYVVHRERVTSLQAIPPAVGSAPCCAHCAEGLSGCRIS